MLRGFLDQLCKELDSTIPKLNDMKVYPFRLADDIEVMLKDLEPGMECTRKFARAQIGNEKRFSSM